MILERVDMKDEESIKKVRELFDIKNISCEDIGAPTEAFLAFIQAHKEFSFLNHFTMKEFTKKVQEQFSSCTSE